MKVLILVFESETRSYYYNTDISIISTIQGNPSQAHRRQTLVTMLESGFAHRGAPEGFGRLFTYPESAWRESHTSECPA